MALLQVQKITCLNNAAFVMNFSVAHIKDDGSTGCTDNSGNYPVAQNRTIDLATVGIEEGTMIWPHVHAVFGISVDGDKKCAYAKNGQTVTYDVRGTTLSYSVTRI